jgi:hypothetical protein
VHHGDICNGDVPREDHEDVPTSLDVGIGAISCGARTGCKAGEMAMWRFEGGGNTSPVHSTAQHPFQNVVAQSKLCVQDAASHGVVGV